MPCAPEFLKRGKGLPVQNRDNDFKSMEHMLDLYFNSASLPPFERRAIEHPARVDAFPDNTRNSLGYRSDEFDARSDLNLAFVGCSWTEGEGVARASIFPDVTKRDLAARTGLDVRAWNFGQSASGMDYASRILPSVIALKPDYVVIVFSGPDRREYFSADGRRMVYSNALSKQVSAKAAESQAELACARQIVDGFGVLESPHQDLASYALHARAISAMLDLAALPWLYTCIGHPSAVRMMNLCMNAGILGAHNYLGQVFEKFDFASDTNPHPGTQSHRAFADLVTTAIARGRGRPDQADLPKRPARERRDWWARLFSNATRKKKAAKTELPSRENDDVYPLW